MHLKQFSFKSKLLKAAQANPVTFLEYGQLDTQMLYMDTEIITHASLQIKSQLRELKKYASENQLTGLSAIQAGYIDRFFVLSKEVKEQQQSAWKTQKIYPIDQYKTYINPKIVEICQNGQQSNEIEFSPTFPFLDAHISRYLSVKVRYYDEDMDEVEETIQNFESRAFQHFYDFLMNKELLNWRLNHGNLAINQSYQKKLKKFSFVLEDYKVQINKMKEDFPELFAPRQLTELNKKYEHLFMPSFEQDMMRRLLKNFRKDLNTNFEKQELEEIMG